MILDRVERYVVEQRPDGVTLRMRQARHALGVAAFSSGVLFLSWRFGLIARHAADFDVFDWVWTGFFGLTVIFGLLGSLYREDWTITERETVATTSFAGWRSVRHLPRTRPLGIRVELRPGSGESTPIYPWRVHVLDDKQNVSGLCVQLQRSGSVDRLLGALRAVWPLDVDDPARSQRTTG